MTRAVAAVVLLAAACGQSGVGPWWDESPLPPGSLRFAAIGDYGKDGPDEAHVSHLVHEFAPELIITLGDNNYEGGEASTIDANIGKYYHDYIGGYHGRYGAGSPQNRFWPAMGNHEFYGPTNPAWQPWLDYFPDLPGNHRYYEVDLGLVHLFVVNSDWHEPDGTTPESPQGQWLQARLQASTACYRIVYFHHPPYSSGNFEEARMRWPFPAWGADVVLSGHEHFYERFEVDGFPYLVNGLGGDDRFGFLKIRPESRAHFNADYGALFIVATPTGIHFAFHTQSGRLIDSLALPKSCPPRTIEPRRAEPPPPT